MKLVVGLGNPGSKYENTRHNAGHVLVDRINSMKSNLKAFKTDVFMNNSGRAVKKLVDFYKIPMDELYVAHDDLDIPLGEYKIQKGVGPKVHNGVLSVEEFLGTSDFWRVRIGVDGRDGDRSIPGEDYVLQDFNEGEKGKLEPVFERIVKELA